MVDDSEDNQTLLKTILSASGIHVDCASNGEDALSLLMNMSKLPDLILLDANMPVMDGYRFRIEQSKSPRLRSIPVIVITAEDDMEMSHKMLAPEGVMMKPLHLKSIVARLLA